VSAPDRSALIGFADALAAPEVAASLLGAGYHLASFVRRGRPVALSRLPAVELIDVTPPERDLSACLDEMATIAARYDVTIPLNDPAVLVCDRALPADAIVVGPRGAQASLALDKRLQLRGAAAAGLAVPTWSEVAPGDKVTGERGTPTVLKPALAVEEVAGRIRRLSPRLIASQAELDAAWGAWGESTPVLLQRWMPGVGGGLFGLADVGGIHHLSAHRRVRMMNPAGSGSSACASAQPPPELLGPVERFLRGVDWQGMFMVELLRSGESWWFMELNGRPWGSLALSRRLGYEYPAWAVARALDDHVVLPDPPPFRPMLCRNLGRELVHLAFVLRGPRSEAEQWPGRWSTLGKLARPRQGTTWYNLEPGMRRLFVYDAWRTVVDQTVGRHR
jgi:hypothetical protein